MQWFHPPAPREYGFYPLVSVWFRSDCLAPDKSIFVGFGFNLSTVDILHIKADEAFIGKDKNQLVNTLFISSFTRLRKRLIVIKPDAHYRQAKYNECHEGGASLFYGKNRYYSCRRRLSP